jgi:Fe2+ transport system protein FeoA
MATCIANENRYHLQIMMLSQLQFGEFGRVTLIEGGHGIQRNLNQLGIHVGDVVSLANRGAFRGPYLVLVHGMQVALGRGVVTHVHVDRLTSVNGKAVTHG